MTFSYMLPVKRLLQVSINNQPAYWDSTRLGTAFPLWKCPSEIALRAHSLLPRDFMERSLNESLRNAH